MNNDTDENDAKFSKGVFFNRSKMWERGIMSFLETDKKLLGQNDSTEVPRGCLEAESSYVIMTQESIG